MLQFAQMSFPEMYERSLVGPLFQPWAEQLVDDAGIAHGERVLDVACGTGIVARLARQRVGAAGRVVGIDSNPGMLAVARGLATDADWRVGDAGALPVAADERFDIVTCQQGIQFFPDRAAAVVEMRRVLAPGGRIAVSVWRPDEEMPVLHELRRIAERRVGPISDRRHSFPDEMLLERLLADAGFTDIRTTPATRTVRFADGMTFIHLNAMALVGMSALAGELAEEERGRMAESIAAESRALVHAHTDAAGFAYDIGANVAIARAAA